MHSFLTVVIIVLLCKAISSRSNDENVVSMFQNVKNDEGSVKSCARHAKCKVVEVTIESGKAFQILEAHELVGYFAMCNVKLDHFAMAFGVLDSHFVSVVDTAGKLTHRPVVVKGPKESSFMVKWSPRVIEAEVEMTFDGSFTAIESFDHGDVCFTVWTENVPDPIYLDCDDRSCKDAISILQSFFHPLKCPLPKGYVMKVNNFKYTIPASYPLPTGKYHARMEAKNQDGVILLCAEGDFEIVGE